MKNNTVKIAMEDKRVLKDTITNESIKVDDKYAKYKTPDLNINLPKTKNKTENVEISYVGTIGLIGLLGIFIWSNPTVSMYWYNFMLPIINLITIPNIAIAILVLLAINRIVDCE